jgi:hypothetical protein
MVNNKNAALIIHNIVITLPKNIVAIFCQFSATNVVQILKIKHQSNREPSCADQAADILYNNGKLELELFATYKTVKSLYTKHRIKPK